MVTLRGFTCSCLLIHKSLTGKLSSYLSSCLNDATNLKSVPFSITCVNKFLLAIGNYSYLPSLISVIIPLNDVTHWAPHLCSSQGSTSRTSSSKWPPCCALNRNKLSLTPSSRSTQFTVSLSYPISITQQGPLHFIWQYAAQREWNLCIWFLFCV